MGAIEDWEGGTIRVFAEFGPQFRWETEPGEYDPIGGGWAIRRGHLGISTEEAGVPGAHAAFELRGGRLQCVGVHSEPGGSEITSSALRRIAPHLREMTRAAYENFTVRLFTLSDGSVAGELPLAKLSSTKTFVNFGEIDEAASDEFDRRLRPRGGRPSLPTDHLTRVAQAYRDAERLGQPKVEFIAKQFPGYSPETIRNWVRLARKRGLLEPFTRERKTNG